MSSISRESYAGELRGRRPAHPLLALLDRRLSRHGVGALRVRLRSGETVTLGTRRDDGQVPLVRLNRWRAITRGWHSGLMGWAEGYMAGDWDCDDPVQVTDWAMANEAALEASFAGSALSGALHRAVHRLRDNTRAGSRRNIAQHYDLGNAFYDSWLDETMSYSAALFVPGARTLADAQRAKYARVLELLGNSGDGRLLEIGCGWGGFAEHWAGNRLGVLDAITLSTEQLAYARERLKEAGRGRCNFSLTDYRDTRGEYDGVVSIEMFEAVGEAHWGNFFEVLRRRLRPGGAAVMQVITIADERFEAYRSGTDFIQRYIFPGGMLPSPRRFREEVERAGLRLVEAQNFGADYARTLQQWSREFNRSWPRIERLGFDERFRRMWNYYLAYCESGFKSGAVDVQLCRIERD